MSLWGPAAEAEIEYRQSQLKEAWGSQGTDRTDRTGRDAERTTERPARNRAEQIRKGIAGMRPADAPRRGLFA